MTLTIQQEQEIRRLLANKATERAIVDAVGASRRQIRNIKQKLQEEEDHNPLASDHSPTLTPSAAAAKLAQMSTSPGGVRKSEMWPILRARYGVRPNNKTNKLELAMTGDQLRYLKEKATAVAASEGKEALFIPEWLPRQSPAAANNMLIQMAGWLNDRAQEYASEFMSFFPDASSKHVFNELVCLAFKQASPEPVQTRCQRNADAAEALQRQLGDFVSNPVANDPFPAPPDAELDRLCI